LAEIGTGETPSGIEPLATVPKPVRLMVQLAALPPLVLIVAFSVAVPVPTFVAPVALADGDGQYGATQAAEAALVSPTSMAPVTAASRISFFIVSLRWNIPRLV
jgi:hypothetical protein